MQMSFRRNPELCWPRNQCHAVRTAKATFQLEHYQEQLNLNEG